MIGSNRYRYEGSTAAGSNNQHKLNLNDVLSFPHGFKIKPQSDSEELTVVQALNFDLVEVQRGGHADAKWTFRDGVSSVTDSDGHVPLKQTQTRVNSASPHVVNSAMTSECDVTCWMAV